MWKMNSPAQRRGSRYELMAWRHLKRAGLKLIMKNFRTRCGEIDLICRDGDTLVFVEVRYRADENYGSAASTVTRNKQRKLSCAAQHYLQARGLFDKIPCRFDVIGISRFHGNEYIIDWIKNAFT